MTDNSMRAAVFGLGSMGYGMASSLLAAGYQVRGFDISDDRMAQFVAEGGMADSREDTAPLLDCAVIVVLNEAQTEDVLFGDNGIVAQMKFGAVVISCATITPDAARRNAARWEHHERPGPGHGRKNPAPRNSADPRHRSEWHGQYRPKWRPVW